MSAPTYVTPKQVAEIMGIQEDALGSVAWLVLQEESQGTTRVAIAKNLGVTIEDLTALENEVTGQEGAESQAIWVRGVVALRTVNIVNQQSIGTGWDAIEAMAVDKIARQVASIKGAGDLDKLMTLAGMANKAVRRGRGEGGRVGGGVNIGINAGAGGASVELPGGNIGTIRLSLSPAIQAQLQQPNRVIDMVANRDQAQTRTANLEMLSLKDTRKIADDQLVNPLEKGKQEIGGMVFDMGEDEPIAGAA